jgi:peptidyl-prolyl cis-trans isomerase C
MRSGQSPWLAAVALGLLAAPAFTQDKPAAPAAPPPPPATPAPAPPPPAGTQAPPPSPVVRPTPPAPNVVAVTVNGQTIPEIAVFRSLKRLPPDQQAKNRPEVIKFLVDNALVDQYLTQQKVAVDPKEVEAKVKQVRDEIQKSGSTFDKVMQDLLLTEAELRTQITAQLRWEKYVNDQATDKVLHDLFDSHRTMFDGTMVHARHILLTPPNGDAKATADAKVRLAGFKKQVEAKAAEGMAKLPAQTDAAAKEKARVKLLEDAFGELAGKESACPSKAQGGDLGWFPYGSMVDPFAQTAFALKPGEMSDVVATQFGYHLILVTDRRAGKEPKFEEVKDDVKEYYAYQLREGLIAKLRPTAQIVIAPAPK